jgi:hypothetical protein
LWFDTCLRKGIDSHCQGSRIGFYRVFPKIGFQIGFGSYVKVNMNKQLYPYEEVVVQRTFSQLVAPYVEAELANAKRARSAGEAQKGFAHLERAHVLGQESTYWRVMVHVLMLVWATRNRSAREALGQAFRIVGAATKTAFGLVPQGNTGGVNVSPFKKMPVAPE